jgi:hypothetical protein
MKIFVAYALVALGIPHFAGMIVGTIFNIPVSLIVRFSRRGRETPQEATAAIIYEPTAWMTRGKINMPIRDWIAHGCYDIFSGIGSILVAAIIFYFLKVPLTIWVPLIMVAWEIILMVCCNQSYRALFCSLCGLLAGWILVSTIHA